MGKRKSGGPGASSNLMRPEKKVRTSINGQSTKSISSSSADLASREECASADGMKKASRGDDRHKKRTDTGDTVINVLSADMKESKATKEKADALPDQTDGGLSDAEPSDTKKKEEEHQDASRIKGRKEKHRRRMARKELEKAQPTPESDTIISLASGSKDVKQQRKRSTSNNGQTSNVTNNVSNWHISQSSGGQMARCDPIFSPDERFLLIAYQSYIAVYDAASALLLRKLHVDKGCVVALQKSPFDNTLVYVATDEGYIILWDWLTGNRIGTVLINGAIQDLAVHEHHADADRCSLYAVTRIESGPWGIQYLDHLKTGLAAESSTSLHNQKAPVQYCRVVQKGKIVILASCQDLVVGIRTESATAQMRPPKYTWRTITCPEYISSLDVRVSPAESSQQKANDLLLGIDLAIGGLRGSIHIYHDFVKRLLNSETASRHGNVQPVTSRRLHWHRNAVQSVKWTHDGLYLMSGGQETVLVLWQLDSGAKETLPHLGAAIENIEISHHGSKYAVRLADNSATIFSTSDMKAQASFAGTLVPTKSDVTLVPAPDLLTVDTSGRKKKELTATMAAAATHVALPGHLLFAVPASTAAQDNSYCYLQTIDAETGSQTARQALTRTKATDLQMGPDSRTIDVPHVTNIATSHDGQWLSTVDEWTPPSDDVTFLTFSKDEAKEEQLMRREVYLKFWAWSTMHSVWELVARIDNPHTSDTGGGASVKRVLGIAANPHEVEFATFGGDGMLKIWRSSSRRRHGLELKGAEGEILKSWYCASSIPLEVAPESTRSAHVKWSSDGSAIAVGTQQSSAGPIFVVDATTCIVNNVHTNLYTGPLLGLGILDNYLVILSQDLVLWDLIEGQTKYSIQLRLPDSLTTTDLTRYSHLTVNEHSWTIAVTIPRSKNKAVGQVSSQIAIFNCSNPQPLLVESLSRAVLSLLPAADNQGFYVVDASAGIRLITPQRSIRRPKSTTAVTSSPPALGLKGIYGDGKAYGVTTDAGEKRTARLLEDQGYSKGLPVAKASTDTDGLRLGTHMVVAA